MRIHSDERSVVHQRPAGPLHLETLRHQLGCARSHRAPAACQESSDSALASLAPGKTQESRDRTARTHERSLVRPKRQEPKRRLVRAPRTPRVIEGANSAPPTLNLRVLGATVFI